VRRPWDRHVLAVSSDSRTQLVTSGVDHIKFWTLSGRSLACSLPSFGKLNGRQQVHTYHILGICAILAHLLSAGDEVSLIASTTPLIRLIAIPRLSPHTLLPPWSLGFRRADYR